MIDFFTGITLGLHLASLHVPAVEGQRAFNPGIYARAENGVTAGVYRNTLGRTSVYAGYTFEAGPFALGLGAVTGYQKKKHCEVFRNLDGTVAWEYDCKVTGSSPGLLAPAVFPSVALPAIAGIVPRLAVIPPIGHASPATVFHLSLERKF